MAQNCCVLFRLHLLLLVNKVPIHYIVYRMQHHTMMNAQNDASTERHSYGGALFALIRTAEGSKPEKIGGSNGRGRGFSTVVVLLLPQQYGIITLGTREVASCRTTHLSAFSVIQCGRHTYSHYHCYKRVAKRVTLPKACPVGLRSILPRSSTFVQGSSRN